MEEKYQPLLLSNQLCFPLYACSKEIVRRYNPHLEALDLTYTQYLVMMVLWEHQSISVKEMGIHLYLDSGTLTPVLKTLEKKGYVTRERNKEDERVLIVTITEAGMGLREKAVSIPPAMCACIALSEEERIELQRLLNKMLNHA